MNRHDRLSRLIDLIIERGSVTVEELIGELGASAATIRRDLDTLARQQLIKRLHGGAAANPATAELPIRYRSNRQREQKRLIAEIAVSLIKPGTVVGLNGGTTTTEMATSLGIKAASDPDFERNPVTVVTNALNIATELTVRPQLRVCVTGGVARGRSYELIGPLTELILPAISVETLFIGVNSIDPARGVFTHHEGEAAISAALVRAAQQVVVLADSSKFSAQAFAKICDLEQINLLITDPAAPTAALDTLEKAGIKVLLAQAQREKND